MTDVIGAVAGPLVSGLFSDNGGGAVDAQVGAANQARAATQAATQQALAAINSSYQQARGDVGNYFNIGYNPTAPYALGGYGAYDQLMGQLGLATPQGGSFNLAQAMNAFNDAQQKQASQKDSALDNIAQQVASAFPHWEGISQGSDMGSNAGELQFLKDFAGQAPGINSSGIDVMGDPISGTQHSAITGLLPQVQNFLSNYKAPTADDALNSLSADQQALVKGYQSGNVPMQTQSGTDSLKNFFNTGMYQLLFNGGANANGYNASLDPNASVQQRFQQSPGYQFALNQGIQALDANAAAKGMALSGNQLQNVNNYAQGVANQDFGNYLNNVGNTYGNYINNLSNISGIGANLASSGRSIAQGTGNSLANLASNYGSNIANLYTSQGQNNANSYLAAGSAQAAGAANQASNFNSALGGVVNGLSNYFFPPQSSGANNPYTSSYNYR